VLTIAVLGVAIVAIVGFGLGTDALGGQATTAFYFLATVATLAVIVIYIGVCVGGAVYFRRERGRYNVVVHLLVPAVGVVIFGAALYGSIYPVPPGPLDLAPYIGLAWIGAGVAIVTVMRRRRPEVVARIGSILAEEDGEAGLGAP
jgi:amino acid transporter